MRTTSLALPLCTAFCIAICGLTRAEEITVGNPLEVTPGIKGAVELTFSTDVNKYYQIQISDDLVNWDNEGYAVKGTGGQMSQLVSTRNLSKAFYILNDQGDPANLAPSVPPGTIMAFAGQNAPSGWLLCDGSVLAEDFAPALFAAIGSAYNTGGEGTGNFRVPDLRGRVPMGRGQGPGLETNWLRGQRFGSERNTLEAQNLPSHSHTIATGNASGSGSAVMRAASANSGSVTTGATGSGQPHNIIQPSLVITYIIKL
jgi:microcystin-dependent protein